VYAERRILEAVEGREEEQLHASVGYTELQEAVREFEEAERGTPGAGARYTQLDTGRRGWGRWTRMSCFRTCPTRRGFSSSPGLRMQ